MRSSKRNPVEEISGHTDPEAGPHWCHTQCPFPSLGRKTEEERRQRRRRRRKERRRRRRKRRGRKGRWVVCLGWCLTQTSSS